jgi:hypothetical protein
MKHLRTGLYSLIMVSIFTLGVQADDNFSGPQTKRIDLPFVHIGINKHADGQKDVDVKAPFVHVNNPAGEGNAQVKAPFTHVQPSQSQVASSPAAQPTRAKTNSNTKVKTYNTVTKTK